MGKSTKVPVRNCRRWSAMQSFPDEHFNRRRFVKANMQAISRLGVRQSFAQTAWGSPKGKKGDSTDKGDNGGGIIRL